MASDDPPGSATRTTCLVAGGGPAGMMLGLLLARAGIAVTVLEKHGDFFRDFRGDTIHSSTLELMHELGLLTDFLRLPHQKITRFTGRLGGHALAIADFSHLPVHCPYIAIMPQWDFLDFIARHAQRYAAFSLRMGVKAQALLYDEGGRVCGVATRHADGRRGEIRADLVIACDGRHSELRAQAMQGEGGLRLTESGAPIDVLWFRLPRRGNDAEELLGRLDAGKAMVLINRGDYFQCAYIIAKGSLPALQARGIAALRADIATLAPFLRDRVDALRSWADARLLTVQINRLDTWSRPGLLCIGDAAHAMSPVGGVGVNLAIQDAVAAANILWLVLREGQDGGRPCNPRTLDAAAAQVQARRSLAVGIVQRFQIAAQDFIVRNILTRPPAAGPLRVPLPLWLLTHIPPLRRLPARLIGLGVRREHIATPERPPGAVTPA